jgi:signal transduction histidine kinase/DNA-binding NarL/FixJ family response regulator
MICRPHRSGDPVSLLDVAKKLRNDNLVKAYRERSVSIRRVVILLIAFCWAFAWKQQTGNAFMGNEAANVFPVVVTLLAIAAFWAFYIRTRLPRTAAWPDAAGAIMDLAGIGLILHFGWNVMLPFVTLLPLTSISVGARYSKREFWYSVAAAVVILAISAPSGYWHSRPVVGLLALTLIVGLPMTVYRVLSTIQAISKEAIQARETQNRFFAMMSHELRTPLNTVINALSLVDLRNIPEDQRELINLSSSSAGTLLARINDVLDVAAIKADQMEPSMDVFSFEEVIDSVYSTFKSLAAGKNLEFTCSVEAPGQWPSLIGDRRRVHQVIANLVGNAIKYTKTGTIRVVAHCNTTGPEEARVIVDIIDTGIGIPDQSKKVIFEPFVQTDKGRARASEGVGLGLYISKSISDRLGGEISVTDNPGGGTVFGWSIPFRVASQADLSKSDLDVAETIEQHRARVEPVRVLVVDDNDKNRQILGKILEKAGHRCDYAASGSEGISKLVSDQYDVAFLDMHMPEIAGDDVLKEIANRATPDRPMPPIVVVSADASAEAREGAQLHGAVSYIIKPVTIEGILAAVESLQARRPSEAPSGNELA